MKAARIVFPEVRENERFQRSDGIKIITEDGELYGVVRATIHIEVDDVVRADVEIMPVIERMQDCEARFFMTHPYKRNLREVKAIMFADGSAVDFERDSETADSLIELVAQDLQGLDQFIFDELDRARWEAAVDKAWFGMRV